LKVELVMQTNGKICNVSKSYPGSEHDMRVRRKSDSLPQEHIKRVDLGYQGLDKEMSNVIIPHKKDRGGTLSESQRWYNSVQSSVRILIEHKFAQLKKFRILGEVYRNFMKKHNLRWSIIAGIINLQCGF